MSSDPATGAREGAGSVSAAGGDALAARYGGIVFDVDGVLVRGERPIGGAAETVNALRERGIGVGFVTNNASRTAAEVAAGLVEQGIPVEPDEIATSSQAAAALLAPDTRCLVIGAAALRSALGERGCELVDDPDQADAVVVGWDRSLRWDDLRRAALALQRGARFIATNRDVTFPASEGLWPGNGAVVAALVATVGREPEVAGKPETAVFEVAAEHLGDGPFLMVGDRPETDLAGAAALGWDTALVLSGVTEEGDGVRPRPTWILDDVRGLLAPPPSRPARAKGSGRVVVRVALATDADAVLGLWDQTGMLAYTADAGGDVERVLAHDPSLFLVAEIDGRVVGTLLGTADGRRGWLQRLAVEPDLRRRGVGRLLVHEVERRLAERDIPQINLLAFARNQAAIAFWRALGYVQSSPVVMLSKRLDAQEPDC